MFVPRWSHLLFHTAILAVLALPLAAVDLSAQTLQVRPGDRDARRGVITRQVPRRQQEPAFARGYTDGYEQGLRDGRSRARYDPVSGRGYRSGDAGYEKDYGSRDAYKNNYRAGFRQGYDDGYRAR